jgi:hypothetical protein
MRPILIGLCVLATACSSQTSNSPTSPAGARTDQTHPQAHDATSLPLLGAFTTVTDVPPPSPRATVQGTAAPLGRFTGTLAAEVNPDGTGNGTFTFTAANGDTLSGTFAGQGVFIPPNTGRLTEVATIEHGTGRFTGASGTFTMMRIDTIDLATGKATGTGSFEGRINLTR